jgi:hypothetical protein
MTDRELLRRLEQRVDRLEAHLHRSGQPRLDGRDPAVSGQRGTDPLVRFDLRAFPDTRMRGRPMSECDPGFLTEYASLFEGFAFRSEQAGDHRGAARDRAVAERARYWRTRRRGGE